MIKDKGLHKVNLSIANLEAVVVGVTTINDAWVSDTNGARFTSLTAGTPFNVHVNVSAVNGSGGLINLWSICVTVIDTNDATIANFASIDSAISIPPSHIQKSDLVLNHLGQLVMPNHALNLRIKVWGADGLTPSPAAPDQSLW